VELPVVLPAVLELLQGYLMREGIIVDVAIVAALSFAKQEKT
jgi:hypothetical protein